jgi:MFS family permease
MDVDSEPATGASGHAPDGTTIRAGNGPWMLLVLFTVPLIGYVHRLIINILIDPISRELAITDTQASFLQGPPFAVAYALMVIPMGLLADRGNRLMLLGAGAVVWSFGTLACGLAPDYGWLFLARLIVGIGEAALTPAVVSFIADSFAGDRRGFAMGVFFTGINAGFSSAYAIGGITLEAAEAGAFAGVPMLGELSAWRQVFAILSVPGFLIPLLIVTLREPTRQSGNRPTGAWQTLSQLFRPSPYSLVLLLLVLLIALLAIADNGIYAWLPRLLSRVYELKAGHIGIVLGIIVAIGGFVGGPLGGTLSDRFATRFGSASPLLVILIGAAIATAAVPLFATDVLPLVYLATGVWVIALVSTTSSIYTFIAVAAPPRLRGVSASAVTSVSSLIGLGFGPTVIALALERFAFAHERVDLAIVAAALPLCVVALALALVVWGLRKRIVCDHEDDYGTTALSEPVS